MVGGDLPDGDLSLGQLPEGEVWVRRVATEDQQRWSEQRRPTMRGYGALGDTDGARAYGFLPIREWLLDCCTVATEVRAERIDIEGDVQFEPHETGVALWFAGLHDIGFQATIAADVIRLLVEPHLQVACEEQLIVIESGNRTMSNRGRSAPGIRQQYREVRWKLTNPSGSPVVTAWKSAVAGPNAERIRFPLRRFGIAAQRAFAEDHLIDTWVGLDGLFKREDEMRGIGDNAARRASKLLDVDVDEGRTLRRVVPRSYKVRGAIVHGRSDYSDEDLTEANEVADDLLRRSLLALISKAEPFDPSADEPHGQSAS
jgi:hypothetical protein